MPICPAGHNSAATDFCDTCGLPIPAGSPAGPATASTAPVAAPEPEPLQPPVALVCPNCGTPNVRDALFCEACGFDFIGGNPPAASPAGDTQQADQPVVPAATPPDAGDSDTADPATTDSDAVESIALDSEAGEADAGESAEPPEAPNEPIAPAGEPATDATPPPPAASAARPFEPSPLPPAVEPAAPAPASSPSPASIEWVAELWIDPDWYAAQGSTDPLPSPGLPDIVPLVKQTNLIGRVSRSRNIFPEIDCELDNGTSRRHARLTTDGSRWWIEDLESANGTFLGSAAGPLPAMPIPRGRTELTLDQRIYVGAWTRIVIRRATADEQAAFAGEPV